MSRVSSERRARAAHRQRLAADAAFFDRTASELRAMEGPLTWLDAHRARTFEDEAALCRRVLADGVSL